MELNFKRHRFTSFIIIMTVRSYIRYKLSLRDICELLLEKNINISKEKENIRKWINNFGPQMTKILKKKHRNFGKRWYLDETYIKINGKWRYVYRCVDENMEVINIYLSKSRDKKSAKKFLKKCMAVYNEDPVLIWSDSHSSYNQIRDLFPNSRYYQVKCLNNKAESSHVPIKQRYRPMRGFKDFNCAKIFLNAFKFVYQFFRKFKSNNHKMRDRYKTRLFEFNNCFI